MLKALELVGFKSFAEKTRFGFSRGITVVVGPNGSGKSNIVDAIKWVLGEQSVKSLRGREMADVIFNGSGARRGMNSAEITLTLDNSNRLLPMEAPEVCITRRVYRSGEGEYLINRQPCRLRDIRDLLAGTGLGTHAYSVIEQGKVDVLLQASAQERRVIFEEAAGIGRFKAKKIEALRRLERVDQNLLRLSDIVDEVDSRLRSVKLQAGKARRYKEYADRLQELRTHVGLVDWRHLSQRLAQGETELASLVEQRDGAAAEAEAIEARLLEAETRTGEIQEQIRESEHRIAADRERIAANDAAIAHQRARHAELEQEIARYRRQLAEMDVRAGDLLEQMGKTAEAVQQAEEHHRHIGKSLVESERHLTEVIARLDQTRGEHQQRRSAQMEQMRSLASLGNQISALDSQVAAAQADREKNQQRLTELDAQLQSLQSELDELHRQREQLAGQLKQRVEQLAAAKARLAERKQQRTARHAELAQLQQRHSALGERIAVLEELEKRYEGLSPGVKEILTQARNAGDGPLGSVRGLVADLFQVGVEAASLVEVALGEKAQFVVVGSGRALLDYLEEAASRLPGRVGFLWLEDAAGAVAPKLDLASRPGVLGRADRFVQADSEYAALLVRLLGTTWIVEKLSHARTLAKEHSGLSFVTSSGELLAADGTLIVGPRHSSAGLISRRSQLRAFVAQMAELENAVQESEAAVARLEEQIVQEQQRVATVTSEHQNAGELLGQHALTITAAEERRVLLDRQKTVLSAELQTATAQLEEASRSLAEAKSRYQQREAGLTDMEGSLVTLAEQIDRLEADRQTHHRNTTETKVELAKSEERLRNLRARMRQFEEGQQERQRAIGESRQRLSQCQRWAAESRQDILQAESQIAELYLGKESLAARTVALIGQREAILQERSALNAEVQRVRAKIRKAEEKIHARELATNEIVHERNTLVERFREDYGIELAQLEREPSDTQQQRERAEIQQEIEELRRKINNLGNVNLEALEELEQLETRHKGLFEQFQDLSKAKNSLVRIIDKINADSRRLFSETLQTVKGHFSQLFRDLFGGGRADIILEEGVDILESGIEIVARPPGKEPRSISLLSGGEKTLTCTALLLAIFRSRPSPFCVLDEVDAALDEANIDRFTKVLQDFLAWTQFIIVTHSKKTMTCANTIYGVTMQESGVSKQVSVRFEDVSDNGEIRVPPQELADTPESARDKDETQAA